MASPTPLHQTAANLSDRVDRVAASADHAVHATQSVANKAFDRLSGSIESARERAHPWADRVSARADRASAYVHEQPIKSLIVAAAAGAVLVSVLNWLTGSRRRHD